MLRVSLPFIWLLLVTIPVRPSSEFKTRRHVCVRFLSIVPVSCCLDVRTQLLAVYLRRRDGVYM